jgi:hypothetical protein
VRHFWDEGPISLAENTEVLGRCWFFWWDSFHLCVLIVCFHSSKIGYTSNDYIFYFSILENHFLIELIGEMPPKKKEEKKGGGDDGADNPQEILKMLTMRNTTLALQLRE